MAKCDLQEFFEKLDKRLSASSGSMTLRSQDFPSVPAVISSQAITARKTYKYIDDCYRLDVVHFLAAQETYRYFGLAILAVVFCPALPELQIRLDDQETQVRLIKVQYGGTTPRAVLGYLTMPHSFKYVPSDVSENPWLGRRVLETGWPEFLLISSGSKPTENWEGRDTIQGFGGDDPAVMVASLMLDFGRKENDQLLVKLETPVGYGGVSNLSPEIHFHLPGSESWPASN